MLLPFHSKNRLGTSSRTGTNWLHKHYSVIKKPINIFRIHWRFHNEKLWKKLFTVKLEKSQCRFQIKQANLFYKLEIFYWICHQSVSRHRLVNVENLSRVKVLLLKDEEGGVGDGVCAHEDANLDGRYLSQSGSCNWKKWNGILRDPLVGVVIFITWSTLLLRPWVLQRSEAIKAKEGGNKGIKSKKGAIKCC